MKNTLENATANTPQGNGGGFDYTAPVFKHETKIKKVEVTSSWLGRGIKEPGTHSSVLLSSFIINIMALTSPLVILQVYDRILPNQAKATLWMLFFGACGVMLVDLALKTMRNYYLGYQSAHYMHAMSVESMNRMLNAKHGEVEKQALSTTMNRFSALLQVAEFHGSQSKTSAIDLPFVLIFLTLMALVGGWIVLVPLVLFGAFVLISIRMNKRMHAALIERTHLDNRKYDFVIEALTNVFTLKALGMESAIQRRYERLQQNSAEGTHTLVHHSNNIQDLSVLFGSISQIAVVSFGAYLTIQGNISLGALSCCTLLSGQVLSPLLRGVAVWTEHQTLMLRRADAAEMYKLSEVHRNENMVHFQGDIVLNDIVTEIDQFGQQLSGASVHIPTGKTVCLYSNSDSLRQSVLRMISGDIPPVSGAVSVNGEDIFAESSDNLRRHIAYVSPQSKMFRGTILENLTHFEVSKKRMAALDAVRILGLEDEINQLPHGYDTKLGEGTGVEFGNDFIMKIAIARALVAVPQILLLNNVSENLDMMSMKHLMRTLEALQGRMTIIFATGDTRVLPAGDIVFSLTNGKILAARLSDKKSELPQQAQATVNRVQAMPQIIAQSRQQQAA